MWYVGDVLNAVLYVRVNCLVMLGCGVARRYVNVCDGDGFSAINVYLDQLKFYIVCVDGRRYVCCSECYVVFYESDEPTPSFVRPVGPHGGVILYFRCFSFLG